MEAVNPFPSPKAGPHTLTGEEPTKGTQEAKRDLSRRNEASNFSDFLSKISHTCSIKLVSIVASDEEEEYAPPPAARKIAVKIPPSVRVKAAKRQEESVPRKKNDPAPVKTTVTAKKQPKRLNGNNV